MTTPIEDLDRRAMQRLTSGEDSGLHDLIERYGQRLFRYRFLTRRSLLDYREFFGFWLREQAGGDDPEELAETASEYDAQADRDLTRLDKLTERQDFGERN